MKLRFLQCTAAAVLSLLCFALPTGYATKAEANNDIEHEKIMQQTVSGRDYEYVTALCDNWKFGEGTNPERTSFNDSSWENVTIPHTWNGIDAQDGNNSYKRGVKWYRKTLTWQPQFEGKLVYVEFTGVNTKTDLYVNGTHVYLDKSNGTYTHRGGYTAFRYNVTDYLTKGNNVLAVKVDNSRDQAIAPISGDFNIYGGIYRPVYLVVANPVHVDLDDNGTSGLYLTTPGVRSKEAPASLGKLNIRANIVNTTSSSQTVTITATVTGDNAPSPITKTVVIKAGGTYAFNQDTKVNNPHLWNGISFSEDADNSDVGYRYTVELTVSKDGTVIDKVTDKVGFRYFWVDKNEGFFLNGEKHPLRGVCRHQFKRTIGSALTYKDHDEDMELIREMGANTIRLSHYPHAEYFYELCDVNGMVSWSEIPFVNQLGTSQEFDEVTKEQLVEMIRQQYNRPSICFWGLENEVGNGASSNSYMNMKRLVNELNSLALSEDTSGRYTTQAINQNYSMNQNIENAYGDYSNNTGWNSDIMAWNIYPGWYGNFGSSFEWVMDDKASRDSRPMAISEYGWGANVNQHEAYPALNKNNLTPYGPWHPEEYQNKMHEEALAYINTHDYLWGTFLWSMFDFAVDSRNEGMQPGLNDKGLVTNDRKIKKDSFFLYKANWNKQEKFAYITSRRWDERENADTYVKVYSNCDSVELFLGNKSLGEMANKGNCVFETSNVSLAVGKNALRAVGKINGETYEDTVVWTRNLSSKAMVESTEVIVKEDAKQLLLSKDFTLGDILSKVKGVNNATYSVYDGSALIEDVNTLIVPNMTLKVVAEDGITTSEYKFAATNICAGKIVTASSTENGNFEKHAVDCNLSTRWTAVNNSYPQNIVIDLEEEYYMGNLTINWYDASDRYYSYTVAVSNDGVNYEQIIDRTDNTSIGLTIDSLGLTKARYLKINVNKCSNSAGYAAIFEVDLNGWHITSDAYHVDYDNRIIVTPALGDNSGLTPDKFLENITVTGNCTYDIKVGTGYVNDGDTLVITSEEGIEYVFTISLPETAHLKKTNAALGKMVYFSTQEKKGTDGADTHGYSAFDGNLTTRWASETNGGTSATYPEWIGVDLGKAYNLSDIELFLETKGGRIYTYELYASLDTKPTSGVKTIPAGFTKIVDASKNTTAGGNYVHQLENVKARYVILKVLSCDKWSQSTKYVAPSVFEMKVNGRTDTTKYEYALFDLALEKKEKEIDYTLSVAGDITGADVYVALFKNDEEMLCANKNLQKGTFETNTPCNYIKVMLFGKDSLSPLRDALIEYLD